MKKVFLVLLFISVPVLSILCARLYLTYSKKTIFTYTLYQKPVSPIPVAHEDAASQLQAIEASSYIIMDAASGVVLAERNADELFFPASTVKMMTALVAKEKFPLTMFVDIPAAAIGQGERALLFPSATFTVSDLIVASLVQSHNAAALSLAAADPQGTAHFIAQMNEKAKELSLSRTHYDNSVGFDSATMKSSARDVALLAKEVIKDPYLREIVSRKETFITETKTARQYKLYNTNALLGFNNQVFGIKTGTTDQAGQVLVSLIIIDGHEVITVVLESNDRYQDTRMIIDWLNSSVDWFTPEQLVIN